MLCFGFIPESFLVFLVFLVFSVPTYLFNKYIYDTNCRPCSEYECLEVTHRQHMAPNKWLEIHSQQLMNYVALHYCSSSTRLRAILYCVLRLRDFAIYYCSSNTRWSGTHLNSPAWFLHKCYSMHCIAN